jgi:hypothetical protein
LPGRQARADIILAFGYDYLELGRAVWARYESWRHQMIGDI